MTRFCTFFLAKPNYLFKNPLVSGALLLKISQPRFTGFVHVSKIKKNSLRTDACKKKFNRVRIIFDRPILVVSQRDTYSIGCYCCCCCGRRLLDKQYYARFYFFLKKRKTIY